MSRDDRPEHEQGDGFVVAPDDFGAPDPIIPGGGGPQAWKRPEQNLGFALAAGGVASLLGALVWTAFSAFGRQRVGYIALGIGFLVGWVVRKTGRGTSWPFGLVAAILTLASCVLGMLLSHALRVALAEDGELSRQVLERLLALLLTTPLQDALRASLNPVDGVFTLIATYQAFQLGFARPEPEGGDELPG